MWGMNACGLTGSRCGAVCNSFSKASELNAWCDTNTLHVFVKILQLFAFAIVIKSWFFLFVLSFGLNMNVRFGYCIAKLVNPRFSFLNWTLSFFYLPLACVCKGETLFSFWFFFFHIFPYFNFSILYFIVSGELLLHIYKLIVQKKSLPKPGQS